MKFQEIFRMFAAKASVATGTGWAFIIAISVIITWAIAGPFFGFSNSWQLFINTGTTIVTLLMIFLLQNTQNRDSKATQIKLDELLRKMKGDKYLNLEEMPDEKIEKMQDNFRKLHNHYEKTLAERRRKGRKATSNK